MQKLTAIWQSDTPHEREWIEEMFGPFLNGHVVDGKHQVVLDNALLCDAFICCYRQDYYAQFEGLNAYLIHFLDETFEGGYDRYRYFKGVFRCFWSNTFLGPTIRRLPLGYSNGLPRSKPRRSATERKFLWSFAGHVNKSSRPEMAKALVTLEPHFFFPNGHVPGLITAPGPGFKTSLRPDDYYQVLLDSMFAPCPMGNVSLECYRVYEALECGSIPIVERRCTLDYFRDLLGDHPIPTVSSWREAAALIQSLIINPDTLNGLQERCIRWWADYKRSYSNEAGRFLEESTKNTSPWPPAISKLQTLPFWRSVELLRHHNAMALGWRLQRHAVRLLQHRKFRVAHRPGVQLGQSVSE